MSQPGQDGLGTAAFAGMDRERVPFAFLDRAQRAGLRGALVTISRINGGAPKPLGTHMAVLEDGRFVGYVSGGCVEAAIAAEVAPLIAAGRDEILTFGIGSRFIDIRFPCGGGVDLLVHVGPDPAVLQSALDHINRRSPFVIEFSPALGSSAMVTGNVPTGWDGTRFIRRYHPRTRLLLVGRGPEMEVTARAAHAAEFDLWLATPDEQTALSLASLGEPLERMSLPGAPVRLPIDPWTATVLMFHEHEWEDAVLTAAVAGDGFYIGALGSVRTQRQRLERLRTRGVSDADLGRIRGPIGLIDRAKNPGTLALSVLAEIAAERQRLDAG